MNTVRRVAVTVFVLDRSGSMGEEIMGLDGRKAPKIEVVKEAMRILIAYKIRFFPRDLIAAIAFGNHAEVLFEPTFPADPMIWGRLEAGLVVDRDRTNMTEALHKAIEMLKRQPPRYLRNIVLLSDGCANEGNPKMLPFLAVYAYANRINIHTIGFGNDLTDFDEDLLKAISGLTHGGKYRRCHDLAALVNALKTI